MIDTAVIVKEAKERLEADRKAIRASLSDGPPPPGLEPVDDATFMQFIEAMVAQYPEEPLITPDGQVVVASPWFAALAYVEGGSQIISRVLRIQRKGGE